MEVIYIDRLFFLELLTDYLLLLTAARISGLILRRGRYLLSALLGAAYSAAVLLPGLTPLAGVLPRLAVGLLMCWIAYGRESRPLRCALVFLAVSAAFGGALWAVSLSLGTRGPAPLSPSVLLLSFGICFALFSLLFRAKAALADRPRAAVRLRFLGREATFFALVDTGNSLRDPLTGFPVMVVSPPALHPILRENTELFASLSPVELLELAEGSGELRGRLRLLSYTALGGAGLLPVFRPELLTIDGRSEPERLIAVSAHAQGDGFDAIL